MKPAFMFVLAALAGIAQPWPGSNSPRGSGSGLVPATPRGPIGKAATTLESSEGSCLRNLTRLTDKSKLENELALKFHERTQSDQTAENFRIAARNSRTLDDQRSRFCKLAEWRSDPVEAGRRDNRAESSRMGDIQMNSETLKTISAAFASAIAVTLPINASADTVVAPQAIVWVNVYAGTAAQGANIQFSPAQPKVEGCPYAPGNILWIDFSSPTQPDGKVLYATVLAAVMAGKTPIFGVRGCGDNGQLPLVYSVQVNP
jgi:hypothetical protein